MRAAIYCALLIAVCASCGSRSQLDDEDDRDATTAGDSGPKGDGGMIPDMVLTRVVIDGDTIIVSAGSHLMTPDGMPLDDETIRLLGVDTPEIEHPPEAAECWGDAAKAFAQAEIGGRTIELTYDVSNGIRDDFGRLLAYVSRGGESFNEKLLTTGNARAFRPFPHRERSHYIDLERIAKDQDLGLWGACQ